MEEHFGGFWRRAMAFFIDKLILLVISLFTSMVGILALSAGFPLQNRGLFPEGFAELTVGFMTIYFLAGMLINMLYFTYFHGTTGQTPGKILFGLQVIQSTGEKMALGIGFLRWVGYIISAIFLYLGFFWIAFDGKKQGWHDKIAGTIVVRTRNMANGSSCSPNEKDLDKEGDIL